MGLRSARSPRRPASPTAASTTTSVQGGPGRRGGGPGLRHHGPAAPAGARPARDCSPITCRRRPARPRARCCPAAALAAAMSAARRTVRHAFGGGLEQMIASIEGSPAGRPRPPRPRARPGHPHGRRALMLARAAPMAPSRRRAARDQSQAGMLEALVAPSPRRRGEFRTPPPRGGVGREMGVMASLGARPNPSRVRWSASASITWHSATAPIACSDQHPRQLALQRGQLGDLGVDAARCRPVISSTGSHDPSGRSLSSSSARRSSIFEAQLAGMADEAQPPHVRRTAIEPPVVLAARRLGHQPGAFS